QQLSAFVDGALTGVSRDLVTRHIAACSSCRERYALWRIYDGALQRALSWEPDERTLEDWSARAELALTADRKGLPAPDFASTLGPGPPPASAAVTSHPSHTAPPPRHASAPSSRAPRPAPPRAPHRPAPPAPVPRPRGGGATRHGPPAPPPLGGTAPDPNPDPAPPWDMGAIQRGHPMRSLFKVVLVVLLAAILLSPFLPETIRVRVGHGWLPRLPRVEFVHADAAGPANAPVAATTIPEPAPLL